MQILKKVQKLIREEFPQWQRDRSDKSLTLTQSEEEQRTLRNLTVQQTCRSCAAVLKSLLGITEASIQRQGESRIRTNCRVYKIPQLQKTWLVPRHHWHSTRFTTTQRANTQTLKDTDGNRVVVACKAAPSGEHIIDARSGIGEMGSA